MNRFASPTQGRPPLANTYDFSNRHVVFSESTMSLIQSAKLNGRDSYRYLADVLERLPAQPFSRLDELLPHCWHRTTT